MTTKIFDKDTILDLTVNIIPLGIIAFFIVFFGIGDLFLEPFPFDLLSTVLSYGLLIVPFAALALLTYFSGKAIAGDEKRSQTYLAGQATVSGGKTLEEYEEKAARGEVITHGDEPTADESENAGSVTTHDSVTDDTDDSSTGNADSSVNEEPTTDDEVVPDAEDGDNDTDANGTDDADNSSRNN